MRLTLCVLFTLSLPALAADQVDPKTELKALEGTWELVAMEASGQPVPAEKGPKKLTIAGTRLTGLGPDMEIKIDAAKNPRWIDLNFKKGDKDYPVQAIYELSKDELKLCIPLAEPGKTFENKRPESFDTKTKPLMLLRLKRVKS